MVEYEGKRIREQGTSGRTPEARCLQSCRNNEDPADKPGRSWCGTVTKMLITQLVVSRQWSAEYCFSADYMERVTFRPIPIRGQRICMKRWRPALVFLLGIWAAVPLSAKGRKPMVEKVSLQVQTEYGGFVFMDLRLERDAINQWVLAGSATNETDRSWRYAKFAVQLLGEDGRPVHEGTFAMDQFLKGHTNRIKDIAGLAPGATLGFVQGKPRVADLNLAFLQRDSVFDFQYVISMIKPEQSDALSYNDSEVAITFTPGDLKLVGAQLQFSLENKTDSPIALPWDKVSYVDWSRGSHRVIHQGVRLIDRDKPQAATGCASLA